MHHITFDQASNVAAEVAKMMQFQYPLVNGVGVTKFPLSEEGEFAVSVHFVGDKPSYELPDRVSGVKLVYSFNVGEIVPL